MTEPQSAPPIFIVGCQRSGTTLLRLILDSHPSISCGPETRFLNDFGRLTNEHWDRLSLYGFPRSYWDARVAEFFSSFHQDYADRRGKVRWADKTPRYALSLDYINVLFPTSQIVHVIRDGRDVVASHRDRWGYVSAIKAVEKWPRYIDAACTAGVGLGCDRYCEVRYESLVTDPEGTLRSLLDFLGEPWDEAVLAHDKADHDVSAKYQEFASRRRADAGATEAEDGPVYLSRVGSHRWEMDPLLRLLVRIRCGSTLRTLGYRGARQPRPVVVPGE